MGLYARRSVQAVAVALALIIITLALTGHGPVRLFYALLVFELIAGAGGIGAELMRNDRGVIAATRLVVETLREAERERSKGPGEGHGNVYRFGG
jgi:hypothetical protein